MKKDYDDKGFVVFDDAGFTKEHIMAALHSVSRVMAGQYSTGLKPWAEINVNQPKQIQRISQIHMSDHALYQLVTDERIGRLAASITGAKQIRLGASQIYYKPPNSGDGGVVGLHRDSQHMPFFAQGVFTAWLPLTDIGLESGPLTYVQGSHQWQTNCQSSGAQIQTFEQQRRALQSEYATQSWQEHRAVISTGGIGFHHKDILHGSPENVSDQPRCLIGLVLMTEDLVLDPNVEDHGYADIIDDNQYCPIIYQEN